LQRFALGDAVWNPAPWKPCRITVTGPWAVTLSSLGTFFDSGVRSHQRLEFFGEPPRRCCRASIGPLPGDRTGGL